MEAVLFVCTANQCRSVIAEHLLRRQLVAAGLHWDVSSAGTHARPGTRAQPLAVAALAERGITVDPRWRSRRVTPDIVDDADLILTATHDHLDDVLRLAPRATKRTFALLQLTRLLDVHTDIANAHHPSELVVFAARARLGVQPRPRALDDVADPIGGPITAYRECVDVLDGAVKSIAARISDVGQTRSSSAR